MNLDIIKKYFLKQMQVNPNLEHLISRTAAVIVENENLLNVQQDLVREYQRSALDLHLAECQRIRNDEEVAEQEAHAQCVREMYSAFISLQSQIRQLNLNELFDCKTQLMKMEIDQEIHKMQLTHEQKRKLNETMENRQIMKKLRAQQIEFLATQQYLEKLKKAAKQNEMNARKKLYAAECELHKKIVRIVVSVKKLKQLEIELKEPNFVPLKKPKPLIVSIEKFKVEKPRKSDNSLVIPQGFDTFLAAYKSKVLATVALKTNSVQPLRPILHQSQKVDSVSKDVEPVVKHKRVTFELQSQYTENVAVEEHIENADTASPELDITPTFENSLTSTPTRISNNLLCSNDGMVTQQTNKSVEAEGNEAEIPNDDDADNDSSNCDTTATFLSEDSQSESVKTVKDKPKEAIKILNHQIIKPADSALPEAPSNVSSSNVSSPTLITQSDAQMHKFNTMLADFMNSSIEMDIATKTLQSTNHTSDNTMDIFTLGSTDFPMSDNDNSFDLMDSDAAQSYKHVGRNNGRANDFL